MEQDYILVASTGDVSLPEAQSDSSGSAALPEALQPLYDSFRNSAAGEYTMGLGAGVDDIPFGPVNITVDNTRISVVSDEENERDLIILQGYAQATLFDRFYVSGILIGDAVPVDTSNIIDLVDHLSRTEEEREQLEKKKIDEVKILPSYFAQHHNDPINNTQSTCGIYIIRDKFDQVISCETVFQAIGIADFADNTAFGLAIAVSANVNTFNDSLTISVAGSLRIADSERFTVAGEVGILNGKLNAIGFSIRAKILVCTEVYFTQGTIGVKGFQEPKIAVTLGAGIAIGSEIRIPEGLGVIKKALFPNLAKFHPLELSVYGEINPMRNYYSLTGKGLLMGNLAISGTFTYDNGNLDAELKAGTVRNNYLNGSLSVAYHLRQDGWNLHGNFNCSVTVDFGKFVGITVAGSLDLQLNSQDYTFSGAHYNRKDLTITVSGMGKIKLLFSFNLSVQKTWVFNLSNTQISPNMLMRSISAGDASALANIPEVLVCESEDIMENELPQLRVSNDVIEAKSWQIDADCSASGLVRIQVAAEYTLMDSSWRLTHSAGDTITVYTAQNAEGVVTVRSFTHNYYELHLDTPDAGNWTLEILGDSQNSGGIYLDALQDEKFITQLEIAEETETAIRFRYSAFTGSKDDTTIVRLCAEEISDTPGDKPFSGVIAYLEETENGEFIWEIPEEFRNNSKYRFYLSAASSAAGSLIESPGVEVQLARHNAKLDCSWELVYSATDTDKVTAYITITNTGAESTGCEWQILDNSNYDSVAAGDVHTGNSAELAEIIASGSCIEIKGNSTVTFQQEITITDKLRDNPSSLHLTVSNCSKNAVKQGDSGTGDDSVCGNDDADEIMFSAMESDNCRKQTISWQAVAGAVSYVLHYALEGDWDESGVYVNDIYDTYYVFSAAPGEYAYRVLAIGSDGKAIGTWSKAEETELLFHKVQTIDIADNASSPHSSAFTLNDGIYSIKGVDLANFTGTLTLIRRDFVKAGETEDNTTLKQTDNDILELVIVNGILKNPVAKILLDNGDYFWKLERANGAATSASELSLELAGEVFSAEQKDREAVSIGDDTAKMPLVSGAYVETLAGEVGFCNKDAIYQYVTDDGGELALVIKSGTVLDTGVKLNIYVQNSSDGEFDCVKTVSVKGGKYTADQVIIDRLVIKNNFYVQVASPDDGKGEYNTDYSFQLSFDVFEDNVQSTDILTVNGDAISDWIGYRNEAHSYLLQIRENDKYAVSLSGDANDAVLQICEVNGSVIEEKRLDANGKALIEDIYLERGNYFVVVDSVDKGEGQFNTDYVLSACKLKTLYPLIDNSDDTLVLAEAKDSITLDSNIENWLGTGDRSDFFKVELPAESSDMVTLTVDAQTIGAIKDGSLTISCFDRFGQELELDALPDGSWYVDTRLAGKEIYFGFELERATGDLTYCFKAANAVLPGNLVGDAAGVSWDAVPGAAGYVVEYSQNDFAGTCRIETVSNKVDFFGLPSGFWQWQVKAIGGVLASDDQFIAAGDFTVQHLVSEANDNTDMFFASASGQWESEYMAQHLGLLSDWSGTEELVTLAGKNKLADIFEGSSDANILVLTDDANGDALFVDDIYTALPGTVDEQQARIAQIDEIRAGLGDDIVDLTSQRFAYVGDGVKICGGLGDDTIWANNGSNTLFGDAGNDRLVGGSDDDIIIGGAGNDSMHGGGGDDIFCFGENWGKDTVEQLAGGSVTLWFESGSESNWNAETLTYTDGSSRVAVSGVSNVALKFGGDVSDLPGGAFADAASEKIFEDKNKGLLA